MIKKIFVSLLFISLTSFTNVADVYICKSKNAKKYHLAENCRGLSNCKAEIGKVTLAQAKNDGKTLCGFEK
jgi:hypothetical protein